MVICLQRGADLHMAQLMPLPLTVSCFSAIQFGFTFLVPTHPGSLEKGPLNGCVCVCNAYCDMYVVVDTSVACSHSSGVEHERVRQSPADTVLPVGVTLPPSSAVEHVHQQQPDIVWPDNTHLVPQSGKHQSVKRAKPQVLVELQNTVGCESEDKIAGKKKRRRQSARVKCQRKKKAKKGTTCMELHCLICGEDYIDPPVENWLQCQSCEGWCHEACTADGENADSFVCDLCE